MYGYAKNLICIIAFKYFFLNRRKKIIHVKRLNQTNNKKLSCNNPVVVVFFNSFANLAKVILLYLNNKCRKTIEQSDSLRATLTEENVKNKKLLFFKQFLLKQLYSASFFFQKVFSDVILKQTRKEIADERPNFSPFCKSVFSAYIICLPKSPSLQ